MKRLMFVNLSRGVLYTVSSVSLGVLMRGVKSLTSEELQFSLLNAGM